MYLNYFSEEDLEDLDAKFDALAEFLGIEFVFERVSDGTDVADSSRCYARYKERGFKKAVIDQTNVQLFAENLTSKIEAQKEEEVPEVPDNIPEESHAVESEASYYSKKKKRY